MDAAQPYFFVASYTPDLSYLPPSCRIVVDVVPTRGYRSRPNEPTTIVVYPSRPYHLSFFFHEPPCPAKITSKGLQVSYQYRHSCRSGASSVMICRPGLTLSTNFIIPSPSISASADNDRHRTSARCLNVSCSSHSMSLTGYTV